MRYYFLALATLVAVCVGCQSTGADQIGFAKRLRQSTSDSGELVVRGQGTPAGPYGNSQYGGSCRYVMPARRLMLRPETGVDGPEQNVLNPLGMASPNSFTGRSTQIKFVEPEGMSVGLAIPGGYAENQVNTPGRYKLPGGRLAA